MKLTEKELYELPLGSKAIRKENEYFKIRGNEWKKQYAGYSYTNSEMALLADKILIPTYTEYIPHKPILDNKEKEYLSFVIRPFRNNVEFIRKQKYDDEEFIFITCKSRFDSFALPLFKKGTMYKGMELNREYTLEELGL